MRRLRATAQLRIVGHQHDRHPKVTLEIFEDTTENLALRLEDGTLDVAWPPPATKVPRWSVIR